ncbi:RNA polymerase sigma factor [Orrella marina]|uniref:RNA polymerase sigma factor n=1 Tax=Orrella marina TaxID=2163011 RepID=UPI00131F4070|nr:RNA polymerase sigma factor [Orrella marina]
MIAIYHGYMRSVTAFVRLYVDDVVAIEEIVDDTFLAIFSKPDQFEGRSSFKTWLLGIARNQCHNWLRKARKEPAINARTDDAFGTLVDPTPPILDHLEQQQVRQIVRLCLMRLPEAQRQVLYWVFYEELSVNETAEQVGCAPGTVKSRMFHAKSRMADCVRRRLDGGIA